MKMYRLFIVLAVVFIGLIYYFYPCLKFSINNIPRYGVLDNDIKRITILYSLGICGTCSTGTFINSLEDRKNILFVVPDDYRDNDIVNFREIFKIEGLIIRGGLDTVDFLKNLAGCKKLDDWRKNYFITLKSDKKIETIKQI